MLLFLITVTNDWNVSPSLPVYFSMTLMVWLTGLQLISCSIRHSKSSVTSWQLSLAASPAGEHI